MTGNFFEDLLLKDGDSFFTKPCNAKQIISHLANVIKGNGKYKKTISKLVKDAVICHENRVRRRLQDVGCFCEEPCQWRHLDKADDICTAHAVVMIAAHLCQKYKVDDDELLKDVLKSIVNCEGGYDRFFSFLDPFAFSFEVDNILYGECMYPEEFITDQRLRVLEYFLETGRELSINYPKMDTFLTTRLKVKDNIRMVDSPLQSCRGSTPLLLACQAVSPEAVLLLLRYGASPLLRGYLHHLSGCDFYFQNPLITLMAKLNASASWQPINNDLDQEKLQNLVEKQQRRINHLKQCIRYFCRVLRSLVTVVVSGNLLESSFKNEQHIHRAYSDVIPYERLTAPAELQHQCRCKIRQCLNELNQLPRGIYELPLPFLVQQYLDLLSD